MYSLLLGIHVLVAILVVLVVLIQSGRSGGISGIFGGGGGDALFSASSQQSGIRKLTVILASLFMATSLGLTFLASRGTTRSVIQKQFPSLPPVGVPETQTPPGAMDPGGLSGELNQSLPQTDTPQKP